VLCKKENCYEILTSDNGMTNLVDFSKEGYGSKSVVL
jgi:hypothetical protein